MKKYLLVAACLLLSGAVLSQQKYTVNVPTADQKHASAIYQLYGFMSGGINFAKSKGVSANDYGKYLGNAFVPMWGEGNNFDAFVKAVIGHVEITRKPSDPPVQVKENADGTVKIISDEKMWLRYFGEDNKMTSMKEFIEYITGVYEPVANHMGATLKIQLNDGLMIYTLKRK